MGHVEDGTRKDTTTNRRASNFCTTISVFSLTVIQFGRRKVQRCPPKGGVDFLTEIFSGWWYWT
jgi:hypothetical protein